ncbi:uncharacterized protein LOC131281942 [Anopheles ziemanni]|uniref:uncharacterized protein LOC131265822 n=1 Tax=Anopheles coustani TaxID=139045 RepID=UPI00265A6FEE|nr:uncharacterized protein LOC131265822 [Anopheles coustani]XP_058167300.1 uncharacterized protein LOC131281942 [Anopheles ziemanni]
MMSPESTEEQDLGVVYPGRDLSPPSAKRLRFTSVDEDASVSSNAADINSRACAKDARHRTGSITESDGEPQLGEAEGEDQPGGAGARGQTTSSLDYTAGSDRSSGSSCTTAIYGAGDSGLVGGKFTDPFNNNNNNNNSIGPLGANNNNNNSGSASAIGTNINNNSIKSRLGEMDEAKFSEFSKFLADSEKDESMATILELLHDNYGLIQRYASGYECKHEKCQYESLHEHFHCHDTFCRGKVLYKKYEIIRHLKWHKKRKESLKYGFYRFSSSDDCSIQYGACQHNHKHTHYHCVHENCDKVYISTSDVQMHANYHRKHEAIVKNGFQRFRATEECNTDYCVFRSQRTTHFHCRRENCKYTFKNKADMEKHKTYHQKDEMLLRDGYKKFLKTEDCTYKDCRFSRVCNHIHCMHENCRYVLHSSGQLLSHKRKHERMDTEVDYRRFQMARSLLGKISNQPKPDEAVPAAGENVPERPVGVVEEPRLSPAPATVSDGSSLTGKNPFLDLLSVMAEITFRTLPIQMMYHMRLQLLQQMSYEQVFAPENVEMLRNLTMMGSIEEAYLSQLYGSAMGVPPATLLDHIAGQAQTTVAAGHEESLGTKRKYKPDDTTDHRDQHTDVPLYLKKEPVLSSTPPRSKLLSNPSVDYRLLKKDDTSVASSTPVSSKGSPHDGSSPLDRDHRTLLETANFLQFSSSKTLFNRKRGRPRKNHVMEVYNNVQDSPQAIFTSFKLEKSESKPSTDVHSASVSSRDVTPAVVQEADRNGMTGRSLSDGSGTNSSTTTQYFPGSNYLPLATNVPQLGGFDSAALFGNFSQLLERHMREVKHEPVATVRSNHLKCVVCRNLFETFADIKNHECHGDRAALEKPLLAYPPSLARQVGPPLVDYRTPIGGMEPEVAASVFRSSATSGSSGPMPPTSAAPTHHGKDSISLVKTAGTFFPDVNANKLKYA